MPAIQPIAPCLWFDDRAEEAANLCVGIFPQSRITAVTRYGEAGREIHGREPGSVMTVEFELAGQPFTALNGGPHFRFNEAISLQVLCDTQEEIDHYWDRLSEGGDPADPGAQRAMQAMFGMNKLDLAALRRAYDGEDGPGDSC